MTITCHPRKAELAAARWVKSSLSGSGGGSDCVLVAKLPNGDFAVRDSKDPDGVEGSVLFFAPTEWEAFLGGVKRGEFDSA